MICLKIKQNKVLLWKLEWKCLQDSLVTYFKTFRQKNWKNGNIGKMAAVVRSSVAPPTTKCPKPRVENVFSLNLARGQG